MATDPVCGARVTEGHAAAKSEHQGRLFLFCSLLCQQEFEDDPAYYYRRVLKAEENRELAGPCREGERSA
jgi:YHS domain-containing protein